MKSISLYLENVFLSLWLAFIYLCHWFDDHCDTLQTEVAQSTTLFPLTCVFIGGLAAGMGHSIYPGGIYEKLIHVISSWVATLVTMSITQVLLQPNISQAKRTRQINRVFSALFSTPIGYGLLTIIYSGWAAGLAATVLGIALSFFTYMMCLWLAALIRGEMEWDD